MIEIKSDINIGDIVETENGFLGKVYSIKINNDNILVYEVEYKSYDTEYTYYHRDSLIKLIRENQK